MINKYDSFRDEVLERLANMELIDMLQNEQTMYVTYQIANRTEVIGSFYTYYHETNNVIEEMESIPGRINSFDFV